jgi:hypothetical protein
LHSTARRLFGPEATRPSMPAHGRVSRTAHAHVSASTPRWHSRPPATSAPRTEHAATTSSCVPRLYPLRSCYAEATFFSVSSLLASALLLPCESAVATISRPPYRRLNRGTRPPTFPSLHSTPLELAPWTSGPGASSSLAALPLLHRPLSTAAFGAPLAPSTPPVASPKLGGAH